MVASLRTMASMPECHVVMTMNTIAPKVSGIQPPSTIFSRLAAKKAKSTTRKTPLVSNADGADQPQRSRITL